MSDRLSELQRQRALVQEHLAWLDGQIAQEAASRPAAPPAPATISATATPPATDRSADELLSRYSGEEAGGMAKDAKRGCLIAFALLMAVTLLLAAAAYFVYARAGG